ncbi:hypothetical protein [Clostridium sp. UBA6640]|uniref:hypothetical protein n=1 Tax=Clostridium sp. UBA6640 TaxID=1946370 RepID=UPI0025B7DDFF|nr:hypothetical protein [Clostridium sp. UBA6640]
MKPKEPKKNSKMALSLYSMAAIMLICIVFNIYASHSYISNLVKTGAININEQLTEVIGYYVSSIVPYVFYCICLIGLGYVVNSIPRKAHIETSSRVIAQQQSLNNVCAEDDFDLDELVKELENKSR